MISGLFFLNYNTDDAIFAELCDFQKLILYIHLHSKFNYKG